MSLTHIDNLDLSVRAYNSLKKAGIITLEAIQKLSDEEIRKLKFMNRKVFAQIKGYQLKEMKLNHALRHFSESEFVYYFEYSEKYFQSLPDYCLFDKCVMTDGESIYLCHFNGNKKLVDVEFIAHLKYFAHYEICGNPSVFN